MSPCPESQASEGGNVPQLIASNLRRYVMTGSYRQQRSAEALAWQHLYTSQRWRKIRLLQLSAEPLCKMCSDAGLVVAATVCDHIQPHKGNVEMFYSGPFQSLCARCHNRHKQTEDRTGKAQQVIGLDGWPVQDRQGIGLGDLSHPDWFRPVLVPLTIVCGPPAAGKTTYVAQHKGDEDIVLDLDTIAIAAFGKPAALLGKDERLACLNSRNERLASLMANDAPGSCNMAWLILTEPSAAKRQWWADTLKPQSIIVMETPATECIARAKADTKQERPALVAQSISAWWQTYAKREGETVIRPENHATNA